ncbi:NALCN channel auxiliary factor 1 isoform X1 [Anolis carolinensis]|uniref:NALCN channel auxiliary factor 1 isoform X1 n=1 Tax=Anolis carolinensis TaxID=28377 RepID=UPI002F2B409E
MSSRCPAGGAGCCCRRRRCGCSCSCACCCCCSRRRFGPREPDKPFADSERAQKWRRSLASLLFFTVLLSDHLWLCVEARQVAAGRHRDRPEARSADAEQCFSLLGDAEAACRQLRPRGGGGGGGGGGASSAELYLPFCNSYTLRELFAGLPRRRRGQDARNCTLDLGALEEEEEEEEEDLDGDGEEEEEGEGGPRGGQWLRSCRRCVLAFQSYDQQARERYREFELVLQKYLQAEEYSVQSGPEECKMPFGGLHGSVGAKITADADCSQEIRRCFLLGRRAMANLDKIVKSRDITLATKVRIVKAMVFPIITYGCESWTIRKAERRKIDAFELWCWRKILRVPWTARGSNQSILQEIMPSCSLEGRILEDTEVFWPHHEETGKLGEDHDAGENGRKKEERLTKGKMDGRYP